MVAEKVKKVGRWFRRNPYLLVMLVALLLYISSFLVGLLKGGEAEELSISDLPEAIIRATKYLMIYSRDLEDIRTIGNYTAKLDPVEIDNNLRLLLELKKELGGRGETSLEVLLTKALDNYIRINNASSIGVKSLNTTAEGYRASKLALDLLALCKVEDSIQVYRSSRDVVETATAILAEIHSTLLLVDKDNLLSRDHKSVHSWAVSNTSILLEGLYWTNQLLTLAIENPSAFKNACKVAREGGILTPSDSEFILRVLEGIDFGKISGISSSSSSAIRATLLKALKSAQQSSTTGTSTATAPSQDSGVGGGAGYKEVEEDD